MTIKIALNIFNERVALAESVKGRCEWDFGTEPPKGIIIRLVCFTRLVFYESYHTFAPIEDMKIHQPPKQGTIDFDFQLPSFPQSYEGKLFKIQYAIEAEIEDGETHQTIIDCRPAVK